jgi:hypothetical protein
MHSSVLTYDWVYIPAQGGQYKTDTRSGTYKSK